jgi:hypothetical protein
MRAEAMWVREQTTQTIGLFVSLAVCLSTILLTIVFWRFVGLPFGLALVRSIAILGVGLITGGIALFLGGRYAKQGKSRDQPSFEEAVQGLADAVSKAQMSDLEKQVLLETWASEGLKQLKLYADKLKDRTVER